MNRRSFFKGLTAALVAVVVPVKKLWARPTIFKGEILDSWKKFCITPHGERITHPLDQWAFDHPPDQATLDMIIKSYKSPKHTENVLRQIEEYRNTEPILLNSCKRLTKDERKTKIRLAIKESIAKYNPKPTV